MDKESEEEKTILWLKTHMVFNLSQTEGLESLIKKHSSKEKAIFKASLKAQKATEFILGKLKQEVS